MAGYLVIRFENDDKAKLLMEKLEEAPSAEVVGWYRTPTTFCDGCPGPDKIVISKLGVVHCAYCKKPRSDRWHTLKNQLEDPELLPSSIGMRMLAIEVWEPHQNDPVDQTRPEYIEKRNREIRAYWTISNVKSHPDAGGGGIGGLGASPNPNRRSKRRRARKSRNPRTMGEALGEE